LRRSCPHAIEVLWNLLLPLFEIVFENNMLKREEFFIPHLVEYKVVLQFKVFGLV